MVFHQSCYLWTNGPVVVSLFGSETSVWVEITHGILQRERFSFKTKVIRTVSKKIQDEERRLEGVFFIPILSSLSLLSGLKTFNGHLVIAVFFFSFLLEDPRIPGIPNVGIFFMDRKPEIVSKIMGPSSPCLLPTTILSLD